MRKEKKSELQTWIQINEFHWDGGRKRKTQTHLHATQLCLAVFAVAGANQINKQSPGQVKLMALFKYSSVFQLVSSPK